MTTGETQTWSCAWNKLKRVTYPQLHSQHRTEQHRRLHSRIKKTCVDDKLLSSFSLLTSFTSSLANYGHCNIVQMQAMKEDPPADFKCKDKFLVQSVAITAERAGLSLAELVWNTWSCCHPGCESMFGAQNNCCFTRNVVTLSLLSSPSPIHACLLPVFICLSLCSAPIC